jgi:alanine racemase
MHAGAPALINGREVPIVGRVSMDMTMLDVTDLPVVAAGDEVTLWGKGLPAENVASFADTIAYELFCRIAERVRRQGSPG